MTQQINSKLGIMQRKIYFILQLFLKAKLLFIGNFNQIQYNNFVANPKAKMDGRQTQERKLMSKSTSEAFLSLKEPISAMKIYTQFQNQIINKTRQMRDNKKTFQEQSKILRENFEDTFKKQDKEIENILLKLTQKYKKNQGNRSKSVFISQPEKMKNNKDKMKKVDNVSGIKQNLDSKSTEKRSFQNQPSNQPQESLLLNKNQQKQLDGKNCKQVKKNKITNTQNSLVHENLTLLSKKDQKQIQIYCCLICYKNSQKDCMWQKQKPYLAHLKDTHQIIPEFEHLLEFFQDQILLSHAFFKGKLVNLMKNSVNKNLIHLIYLLHKQRYEQLYFCSCKNTRWKTDFPIIVSEEQFYKHLKRHSNQKLNKNGYYSHLPIAKDNFITFSRNQQFDLEKVEYLYQRVISKIKEYFLGIINNFTYKNLVTFNYLNNIELISCSKKLRQQLSNQQTYNPIPYCTNCKQFSESWSHLLYHSYINKCKIYSTYDYSLSLIKQYMSQMESYKQFHLPEISDKNIPKEDLQLLKAQLILMKSQKCILKCRMICADCEQVFSSPLKSNFILIYIKHIYLKHPQIHPLNNYQFTFMLENTLSQQDSQK